jgi:hypothetical protein
MMTISHHEYTLHDSSGKRINTSQNRYEDGEQCCQGRGGDDKGKDTFDLSDGEKSTFPRDLRVD